MRRKAKKVLPDNIVAVTEKSGLQNMIKVRKVDNVYKLQIREANNVKTPVFRLIEETIKDETIRKLLLTFVIFVGISRF